MRCAGQGKLAAGGVGDHPPSLEQEIGDDVLVPPNCTILNPSDLVFHPLLFNAARYTFILS